MGDAEPRAPGGGTWVDHIRSVDLSQDYADQWRTISSSVEYRLAVKDAARDGDERMCRLIGEALGSNNLRKALEADLASRFGPPSPIDVAKMRTNLRDAASRGLAEVGVSDAALEADGFRSLHSRRAARRR